MKKVFLMLALTCAVLSVNAQIATENAKILDNVSVGVTVGATTPMDLNSVFPLNTNVGLKIQKDFTPVVGVQIEGLAVLNDNHFSDLKTVVKATNLGLNGVLNLTNWIGGYNGAPRLFEVSAVGGIGWLHGWDTSCNHLTAKTGLDLALNLGSTKAHSIVLTPAVYWNINKHGEVGFNKNNAQLALNVTYVYHFKTSNGTRHFKLHDVGALNEVINNLQNEVVESNNKVEALGKELADARAYANSLQTKTNTVVVPVNKKWVVEFAQNSTELTEKAKTELDNITTNVTVTIVGSASPEGKVTYNQLLSERRAQVVADYLTKRGVTVSTTTGVGAETNASNRLVIVTVTE